MEIAGSNPAGDARAETARYAKRKSGEAQTFVIYLWVRFPPVLLKSGDMRRLGMGEPKWL